jgi:pyrroline-5-carboxylate reductase
MMCFHFINHIQSIESTHIYKYIMNYRHCVRSVALLTPSRWLSSTTNTITISSPLASKMCVLGGGQMCEAILAALLTKQIQPAEKIVVYDVNEKRLAYLRERYGVLTSSTAQGAAQDSEVAILAVKPQNVQTLANSLKLSKSTLIVSIVAGLTITDIKRQFDTLNIVRSMPNTPAMIQEGVTVWMATPETSETLVVKAKTMLDSLGDQHQVTDEVFLDMATAVSGSGPAVSRHA